MVSCKFIMMSLGLVVALSTAEAIKADGPSRLAKRDCDFTCTGNLSNCDSKCGSSGVQRVLLSVCYDNTCYCGYQPA
ncbi:hypothetical protein BC940DRAFT_301328 [Gongronella butleri]|nr:hypothetical protein BC940DRAFT_301328 [Gongronella butleri]